MAVTRLAVRRRRRHRRQALMAAAMVIVVGVVLAWVLTRDGGTSDGGPRAATGTHACDGTTGATGTLPPSTGASISRSVATAPSTATSAGATEGLDVRTVGAVGDGATDDAPAIRQALASADSVHIPAGTYLLDSYAPRDGSPINADFVFSLRDGQTITADAGAVFKMADGSITGSRAAWGGNVFLANGAHDVTISGLTLDLNGSHNLVPAGRTITGYGLYMFGAQHVRLTDVAMVDTPGQNYVVAQSGGDDIRVERSTFRNGGTSIPGNRNQTDFSALYFTATNVTVDGITIEHDHAPFDYSGGVELHASHETVTDSRIEQSWPAVYVGPDPHSGESVQTDVTVSCNSFTDVGKGVIFNAGGDLPIDRVRIVRNDITLAAYAAFPSEPTRGIDQDMPTGKTWTYHHIITGLTIGQNLIEDSDASADAAIRLSQVHSATIADNELRNVAGAGLELHSSPWGTQNVTFQRNGIDWLGATPAPAVTLSLGGSSTEPATAAFTASNVTVAHNQISLQQPNPNKCAVFAEWDPDAGVSGIRLYGNTLPGISTVTCGPRAGELQTTP